MHPQKNPRKHHPRMPRRVRRGASWGGACTCPRLTRTTPHCARRTTSAQMKTGEGGYELAIIMSMIAHQRLRGGRVLGEGAGGGVDQDHRAEDDVPAHRRRSEDHEGRAETSQTSRRRVRAQTILCGGVCATQLGSDLTTYIGTCSRWRARRRRRSRSATATASPACSAEPRSETCTLGCPPPARRCVIRIFCFLEGRTASGLCRSYVCLGAQRDGDARARARATRTRRRRGHTQHTGRRAQPYARREGRHTSMDTVHRADAHRPRSTAPCRAAARCFL